MTQAPLKPRRRPVQSRSRVTRDAILEAFVRLLLEKTYARLTIRDIAAVAGVGLGTVYEYFPSKKSIAANCIHQRFKGVGTGMTECIEANRGTTLARMVDALLDTVLAHHTGDPQQWSALIYLERQISDQQAYQTLYRHFVEIWVEAIHACVPAPDRVAAIESAEVLHAAVYGLLYQTLMCRPQAVATPLFRQQLGALAHGYLNAVGSGGA